MKTLKRFMVLLLISALMIGSLVTAPLANAVAVLAAGNGYEYEVKVKTFDNELDLTSNETLDIAYPVLSDIALVPAIQILNGANQVIKTYFKDANDVETVNNDVAVAGKYAVAFGYKGDNDTFVRLTKNYDLIAIGEKPTFEFVSNDTVVLPSKVAINDTKPVYIPVPNVVDAEGEVIEGGAAYDAEGNKNADIAISVKCGSTTIEVKTVTEAINGKKVPYFNVNSEKSGIYTISYSYNKNNVVAYSIREVEVSKSYDASKVEHKVTLADGKTFPVKFSVGVETELPAVKVVDVKNNNENITEETYTQVKVELFTSANATGVDQAIDGMKFTPKTKLSNGAYYKFTYTVKDRHNEVIDTLVYTCSICKDDVKPELFIVNNYTITDGNVVGEVDTTNVDYLIPSKIDADNAALQIYVPAVYATDNFVNPTTNFNYLKVTRSLTWTSGEETKTIDLSSYPINESKVVDISENYGEGTYTLTYKAEDCQTDYIENVRNTVSRTYTIVVSDDVDESNKPTIKLANDFPSIVVAGRKVAFGEPTVVDYVSTDSKDTIDARTHYDVEMAYVDNTDAVIDGLTVDYKVEDGKIVIANVSTDARVEGIKVEFKATDYAHRSAEEYTIVTEIIKVAKESNEMPVMASTEDLIANASYELNEKVELSAVEFTHSDYKFLTVNFTLIDPKGNIVPSAVKGINTDLTASEFVVMEGAYFVAAKAGTYKLIVTATDLVGNSAAYVYTTEVVDNSNPVQIGLKSSLQTSVEVGETVILPKPIIEKSGEEFVPTTLTIRFVGGLNGDATFNQSTFEFVSNVEIADLQYQYVVDGVLQDNIYTFSVVDNTDPELGVDESYFVDANYKRDYDAYESGMVVSFPKFTPSDMGTGIKNISILVTDSDNNEILKLENEAIEEAFAGQGAYSFTPNDDGVYTVKYTAVDNAGNDAEYTITFNIGDIDKPDINASKLENIASSLTYKKNLTLTIDLDTIREAITDSKTAEFVFDDDSLVDETVVSGKGTIKVTLTGPSGSKISNNSDDKFNFNLANAGDYTLKIVAKDVAGHSKEFTKTITVNAEDYKAKINTSVLEIVLIVISLVILAGVIIYFVKTRDKKSNKKEVK